MSIYFYLFVLPLGVLFWFAVIGCIIGVLSEWAADR